MPYSKSADGLIVICDVPLPVTLLAVEAIVSTAVETIASTASNVTGSGTSQITINPSADFEYGIEYYILIDSGAFDDANDEDYTGITSTTALVLPLIIGWIQQQLKML